MNYMILSLGEIDHNLSSKEIKDLGAKHSNLLSGESENILANYIEVKRLQLYINSLTENLSKKIAEFDVQNTSINNAKIQTTTRRKWDYSSNSNWNNLNNQSEALKDKLKTLEAELKSFNLRLIDKGLSSDITFTDKKHVYVYIKGIALQ